MSRSRSTAPQLPPQFHHEKCVCSHCRCQHGGGFMSCDVKGCECARYTWPGRGADLPADHLNPAPQVGDVWRVRHSRKGEFTARVLENTDTEFMRIQIVKGTARGVSRGAVWTEGESFEVRRAFVAFLERLEQGGARGR